MCSTNDHEFESIKSKWSLGEEFPNSCRIGPHACKRVYRSSIFGIASQISEDEHERIRKCLSEYIDFEESDGEVKKAENVSLFRVDPSTVIVSKPYKGKRKHRKLLRSEQKDVSALDAFTIDDSVMPEDVAIKTADFSDNFPYSPFSEKWQKVHNPGKLWNLDRVDQRSLPLDGMFYFGKNISYGVGTGVTIYVIDTGISKDHVEFMTMNEDQQLSGPSRVEHGWNFIDDSSDATDLDAHGSHVAATAIGLRAGVAKGAKAVAVKVLDENGFGSISDTVAGLDWVAANAQRPAIAMMSLGVSRSNMSMAIDSAVKSLLNQGITVVAAAGNDAADACNTSPAAVRDAITVGATAPPEVAGDKYEEWTYFESNQGTCVDIFAPGANIWSACAGSTRCKPVPGYRLSTMAYGSGTSMAAPLVVGTAAQYLELYPDASPQEVKSAILNSGTLGRISPYSFFLPETPNLMLMSRDIGAANNHDTNVSSEEAGQSWYLKQNELKVSTG